MSHSLYRKRRFPGETEDHDSTETERERPLLDQGCQPARLCFGLSRAQQYEFRDSTELNNRRLDTKLLSCSGVFTPSRLVVAARPEFGRQAPRRQHRQSASDQLPSDLQQQVSCEACVHAQEKYATGRLVGKGKHASVTVTCLHQKKNIEKFQKSCQHCSVPSCYIRIPYCRNSLSNTPSKPPNPNHPGQGEATPSSDFCTHRVMPNLDPGAASGGDGRSAELAGVAMEQDTPRPRQTRYGYG